MGPTILPTFKGYTVDLRLREFRRVPLDELPEFIRFDSPEGMKLFEDLQSFARDVLSRGINS